MTTTSPAKTEDFLEAVARRPLVGDGAMGTALYEQGYFINRSFDEANLIRPDTVLKIHKAHLKAGAEVLETNTFSANRLLLQRYEIPDKADELNRAGVQLARQAAGSDAWVAGALGPTGEGLGVMAESKATLVREVYEEQLRSLIDEGVDLLVLETFHHLREMKIALTQARSMFAGPIMAQMSFEEDGRLRDGSPPERVADLLATWGANVVGINCCEGPAAVFDAAVEMVKCGLPVSVQPNAGRPRRLDQRVLYMATPEYFGVYARRFLKAGIRIVGGCCGTGPEHIQAVAAAVRMQGGGSARLDVSQPHNAELDEVAGVEPVSTEKKSSLAEKVMRVWNERLGAGTRRQAPKSREDFVVSVEVNPSPGLSTDKPIAAATKLLAGGVDVINIADGPRAAVRMSNQALAMKMMAELGNEVILHVCCRDRNLLGLQSDILGAHVMGLRNVVIITGDPPKLGDYPKATAVFDMDSIELLRLVNGLNRGIDPAGKMVGEGTEFFCATGAEPAAVDYDRELERLKKKIDAGAEMVMTQPVYDAQVVRRFLDDTREFKVPILLGLCPLVSHRNAEFLHNEVPGMSVPEPIRQRMKDAGKSGATEGIEIAREMMEEFADEVVGVYVMPQLGRYSSALKVLRNLGYGAEEPTA